MRCGTALWSLHSWSVRTNHSKETRPGGFVVSQPVLPPRASPGRSSTPILPSVWCELSSSTRAQGGAGQALDGPHLHAQPLLGRGWRRKGGLRQPSPVWAPGVVSPWPGHCSSSSSSFTAQVGTGLMDSGAPHITPPLLRILNFGFHF